MVRSETLPGGMTLLVEETHVAPVAALALWVNAGAADEPSRHSGVFHFLEHMVLKDPESRRHASLTRTVQDAGGYLNARTGYDHTAFYQVIPSGQWREVLRSQRETLRTARFESSEVASERSVVIEEGKMSERDPSVFAWRRLMEGARSDSAYGRPIVGTEETLNRLDESVLSGYLRRYYVPSNMLQVVVGDVDADEVVALMRELHGDHAERGLEERGLEEHGLAERGRAELGLGQREVEPPGWSPHCSVYEGPLSQPYLVVGFEAPPVMAEDTPLLDAMSGLLGLGRSSRLRRRLRTSLGIVSDIGAGVAGHRDTGVLAVRAVGQESAGSASIVEELFRELRRLKVEPVSATEMQKNLRRLESGYLLEHETVETRAMSLGFFGVMGDHQYAEEYINRLAALTPEDIMRAANEYLDVENAAVVAYVPSGGASPDRVADDLAAAAHRGDASPSGAASRVVAEGPAAWGGVGRFIRPHIIRESRTPVYSRATLDNGAGLVVREVEGLPLVSIAMGFRGGFIDEPDPSTGLTNITLKHMLRGTATRTADELADDVEGLGSGLSVSADRDGFGVGSTLLSKHFVEAAGIIGEVVSRPALDPTSFGAVRAEAIAEIGEAEDHPLRRTMRRMTPLLFPGHAYGRLLGGTMDTLEEMSPEDTVAWHAGHFAAPRLSICVVGDVSANSAADVLSRAFDGLSEEVQATPQVREPARPAGRVDEDLGQEGQSSVAVGFHGPPMGTLDSAAMHVVSTAMTMMGGRLWDAMRERPPYAYSVRAVPIQLISGGALVGYVTTPPGQEDAAVETFVSEFELLARDGLSADELERGRRYLAGLMEISMQRGAAMAASYALAETCGIGYERVDRLPDIVRGVTSDDVVRVARLYLTAEDGPAVAILRG